MRVRPDYLEEEDFPVPFGRYTLLGLLGEGGMARVFEAELRGPQGFRKRAALKVIRAGLHGDETRLRKGLIKEARLGGLLHHPNVVETYDFGEAEGQAWIAMEVVRGIGLDELLADARPLPAAIAMEIAAQICQGLEHAHDLVVDGEPAPLVHRDLKPSNVMLSRSGLVKVLDFGIAKATHLHGNTTETGMTKGTPAYMSPEQAAGDPVDARSDIFAMGAIVFELLTGRRFFQGDTVYSIMLQVVRVDELAADPATFRDAEGIVPGIADVLRRCLVRDRDLRWSGARVLEKELRRLQGRIPAPGPIRDWLEDREAARTKDTEDLEALSLDDVPGHRAAQLGPTLPLSGSVRAGGAALADGGQVARPSPPPRAPMPPIPKTPSPPTAAVPGLTTTRPMDAGGATLQRQGAIQDGRGPRDRSAAWTIGLVLFLLVGGMALWMGLDRPPPTPEPVAEAPTPEPAPIEPPLLEPAEPTPEPAVAEPTPRPAPVAEPAPTPEPTPAARPEPRTPAPKPTVTAPPKPTLATLRHSPPPSAVIGAPNRISVVVEDGDCTPAVLYGPWSARDGDLRAQVMSSLGGGGYEAELFIPYASEWRRGFRYAIRCGSDDAVARWPTSGAHKVDALAR